MDAALSLVQPEKRSDEAEQFSLDQLFAPYLEDQATEWVLVAGLDSRGCLVRFYGCDGRQSNNVNLVPCVRAALHPAGVRTIVIAHNHPVGPARPSAQDLAATRQIAALCRLANAKLLDHLIFSPHATISLRALGYLS